MKLTLPSTPDRPRIAFFGIDCHFTHYVLKGLLEGGASISGIVLPGPPGIDRAVPIYSLRTTIPLMNSAAMNPGVDDTLRQYHIPAFRLGNLRSEDAIHTLLSFNANVLVCACFPSIIPRALTNLFRGRAINIHPSLLPDKRGPDPLFWTFREGSGHSGVTIHELSPRFDAGAVLSQRTHIYSDGTMENELEASLASVATEMILELLPPLVRGNVRRVGQDNGDATYAPWPGTDDFRLDPSMCARAAFNFVRGIKGRGVPIRVEHQGIEMIVVEVIRLTTYPANVKFGATRLRFSDGYLIARLRPDDD
jgi:methionyl-tRNA formyltransferase